ncbi:hypothetical protein DYH09_01020 [bacterium CPR1]|nr:hypothetical protein [bacterium CPR1]
MSERLVSCLVPRPQTGYGLIGLSESLAHRQFLLEQSQAHFEKGSVDSFSPGRHDQEQMVVSYRAGAR